MPRSDTWKSIVVLQKAGKIAEAKTAIEQSRRDLSPAELAECLGNDFFSKRQFQEAAIHYEQSIALEPEHVIARYQYLVGIQEHKEQNYVEAFKRFVSAIESEPEFVDSYVELGAMLMVVGDAKGALKCFEDALALEPLELGNHYNIVGALKELSKTDMETYGAKLQQAVQTYESAKKQLAPMNADQVHELPKV